MLHLSTSGLLSGIQTNAHREKNNRFVQVPSESNAMRKPHFSGKVALENSQIICDSQMKFATLGDELLYRNVAFSLPSLDIAQVP